ncbi:MAG TPA: oligosaccharide flippase family protein [Bacilli bacterium]|nr:oligosaccharide flippase family protein [Bacilli bacterium]
MKNKFIKSTIILIIGGLITKLLGFVIKIVYTRMIGEDGISLFMLVTPAYSLFITIAQLGLPIAISKLVAENKNSKKIIFSIIPLMLILNFILIVIIFSCSSFIANDLLKEPNSKLLLMAMALVLPFISLSSIIRGYFFGKQKMFPHTLSNIIEQIVKLGLIFLIIPILMKKGIVIAVSGLILLNIISEIVSIIVFLFFLPKNFCIKKKDIKPDINSCKEVLKISIPSVSARFIGNIGFFFEPIILTNILISIGYSSKYIVREYGIYNAYSIPLLLLPSFFIAALASALVPEISKFYQQRNLKMVKRRFNQALGISFIIGLVFNIILYIYADDLLKIIYNTTSGTQYIKFLAPFFLLFYLEGPMISMLQALNKATVSMKITLYGVILKLLAITILSFLHIGIYGLVASEIINIIFVVILNYKEIRKVIN